VNYRIPVGKIDSNRPGTQFMTEFEPEAELDNAEEEKEIIEMMHQVESQALKIVGVDINE
jgi:hypothetical protein